MRRRTKDAWQKVFKLFSWYFFAAVLCLSLALIHFDDENVHNTYTIRGVVTDVEYHFVRAPWLTFKINGDNCYYMIADAGDQTSKDVTASYRHLETSGKEITAIITSEWDLYSHKGFRVVGVAGENGNCFSVASHNERQALGRIAFSIIPLLIILGTFYFQILIIINEVIVPARKKHKRRTKEQAQKAKFSAQKMSKQERTGLKQGKRSRKKRN